jgi:cytidyltransferase-like protein
MVSGGFDPIHSGHIAYFKSARELGNILIVGVNSDAWLERKKGRSFMPQSERASIVESMACVDSVVAMDQDMDADGSAIGFIMNVINRHTEPGVEFVFANGGDRTSENIPEMRINDQRLEFAFGVGGDDKKNSSSWILGEWKYNVEQRVWGKFTDLFQDDVVRVKELVIQPGQGISYQRHFRRSEMWFVSKGMLNIKHSFSTPENFKLHTLRKDEFFHVKEGDWHQAYNPFDEPAHIIEIQYGSETTEDDIERLEYYDANS